MVVRTGFIIMFAGVVLGIIGKKLFNIDIVSVVGVLLSVAGMFMIAYPFIFPSPRRRQDAVPRQQPGSMKPADPTKKLTQMNDIDFISASVTEGTTDLLKTPTTTSPDI